MFYALVGIIFSLLILIPITLTIWLLVYAARAATRHVGRCGRCGYDLRGLESRRACPECGQPFTVTPRGDVVSGGRVT